MWSKLESQPIIVMKTYSIYRYFQKHPKQLIKEGLTLDEALEHCGDPETSSKECHLPESKAITNEYGPWFDGYVEE
jgi:hypothetical protein